MAGKRARVTIWFLCGVILCVYGVAIIGSGIYNLYNPPQVVGAELHLDLYWGFILLAVGAVFIYKQWPDKVSAE